MATRMLVSGDVIAVFTHYDYRDRCKSVVGYDWRPLAKAWVYPAGLTTAVALDRAFQGVEVQMDSAFVALLYHGSEMVVRAKAAKVDDLPPMLPLYRDDPAPWLHQRRAFWFCQTIWGDLENPHGGGAMLALDMGTGKSACAVILIANYRFRRVLILAPAKVVNVWPEQFARHAPGKSRVLELRDGSVKKRAAQASGHLKKCAEMYPDDPAVIITNYECARESHFAAFALNREWDLVVADECHRLRDPSGLTSKFVALLGRKAHVD